MNAARAGYLTGLFICLPLLIHLWGTLNASETGAAIALTVQQTLTILLYLQIASIFLSTAWFIQEHSIIDCLLACIILATMPLPFFTLAWLAAAISALAILKIMFFLTGISLLAIALVWPSKRWKIPIRLDLLLSMLAAIGVWSTSEQWLSWLL